MGWKVMVNAASGQDLQLPTKPSKISHAQTMHRRSSTRGPADRLQAYQKRKPTTTLDTNVNTSQSSDPNNPIHGTPKESKQSREYKKEKSNAPAI
jgi:hypothetical protein